MLFVAVLKQEELNNLEMVSLSYLILKPDLTDAIYDLIVERSPKHICQNVELKLINNDFLGYFIEMRILMENNRISIVLSSHQSTSTLWNTKPDFSSQNMYF